MSRDSSKGPRLRTVNKTVPPYPLNEFPSDFGLKLGRELVYLIATKGHPSLEGEEWEEIFANCIGAEWKPSNVGLDDVALGNCAWGAKTIKYKYPERRENVRLISGRNSPVFSFGESQVTDRNPKKLATLILDIWNERVSFVRQTYKHLRTVVLIKSYDLLNVVVFEFKTIRYNSELYHWEWNNNKNLEGFDKRTGKHKFTWQPHGSQFTIIEEVPQNSLVVNITQTRELDKEEYLERIGFDDSWITVRTRNNL